MPLLRIFQQPFVARHQAQAPFTCCRGHDAVHGIVGRGARQGRGSDENAGRYFSRRDQRLGQQTLEPGHRGKRQAEPPLACKHAHFPGCNGRHECVDTFRTRRRQGFARRLRKRISSSQPDRRASVQKDRDHEGLPRFPYFFSSRLPQSPSAGSVRSTPGMMVINPFMDPKAG